MIINVDWKCEPDADIGYSQNGTANNYSIYYIDKKNVSNRI